MTVRFAKPCKYGIIHLDLCPCRGQLKKQVSELKEALRKVILWAESMAARRKSNEDVNWTYLEKGRKVLERNS